MTNLEPKQEGVWARLCSFGRWKTAAYDLLIWFMFGIVFTTLLSHVAPGYPIVVGTPSIQTGVYWLTRTHGPFNSGDLVSFSFKPAQDWIQTRYGAERLVHTKMVTGVPGDVVFADEKLALKVCRKDASGNLRWCRPVGAPRAVDSKGRVLYPWLKAGQHYELKAGELWITGQHPNSLDSRYHGPIQQKLVHGRAKLMFAYGEAPLMEIPLDKQGFTEIASH